MSSNDHINCCSKFSASPISGEDLIKRNFTNQSSGQAIWKRLHENQTCINFPGSLDEAKRQASAEGKHVLVSIDDREVTSSSSWRDPHLVDIITNYFIFWQRSQGHAPEFEKNYVTKTPFIGIVKSESGKLLTTAADSSSEAVLHCLENQLLTEGRKYTTPYNKRRRVAATDAEDEDDLSICISNSLERFLHVSTPLRKGGAQKRSLEEDVTSSPPHKRALLPFKKRFSDGFAKDHIPNIQDHTPNIQDHTPNIQDHTPNIQDHTPNIQDHTLNIQDHTPNIQDHTPNIQDHTPNIQDHTPNIQDHTPNIQDHTPNIQDHTPNIQDHTPNIQDHTPNIQDHTPNIQDHTPNIQDHTPNIQDHTPNIQDHTPNIQDHTPNIQDCVPKVQDCVPDIQKDCIPHSTLGLTNQCLPDVIKIPSNSTFCLSIRHIGGERHKMLVSAHDRISRFNHLLHSLGYDCEKYQLVGHFPTRILSAMDPMCTLQSAGLHRDEVLFICEKDEE